MPDIHWKSKNEWSDITGHQKTVTWVWLINARMSHTETYDVHSEPEPDF